jgi:oligopeptide/dipeptide ABC transporter ATP-binding protein
MISQANEPPLLEVVDLSVDFPSEGRVIKAVDNISLNIGRGTVIGVVGESGSGKSVTSKAILRLLAHPARVSAGSVRFEGQDLLSLDPGEMQRVRGSGIAMISQDPTTSLNPVMTVGDQLARILKLHKGMNSADAWEASIQALRQVEIPSPERRMTQYPHELSGGMCQRVMIAMAMASEPRLLIADEPTTALDVTVQSQIMSLLQRMREERAVSILFISHDIALVSQIADEILVLYAGREMERGPIDAVLSDPKHPYTRLLLHAMPHLSGSTLRQRLATIPGQVPSPTAAIRGCIFAPRCPSAFARCRTERPPVMPAGDGRSAACWLLDPAEPHLAAPTPTSVSRPAEEALR